MTMVYAQVHDEPLMADYYQAMAKIEVDPNAEPDNPLALLDQLENDELDDQQREILEVLRRCLAD